MFILSFGIYIRLDSCDLPLNEEKKRNISKPFVEDKFIKKIIYTLWLRRLKSEHSAKMLTPGHL